MLPGMSDVYDDDDEDDVFVNDRQWFEKVVRCRPRTHSNFHEPAEHRTFEWYVALLSQQLDREARYGSFYVESLRPNMKTKRVLNDVLRAIYNLFHGNPPLLPKWQVVDGALQSIAISDAQFQRVAFHLSAFLREYLDTAKRAEDENEFFRVVPLLSRRRARKRENLPDPKGPAWSRENRKSSNKVQVSARISKEVREQISKAVWERGISQSEWMNEAIVRQLAFEGFEAVLEDNFRPSQKPTPQYRRAHRPKGRNTDPKKSPHAAVNRQDNVISIRIDPLLAGRIDDSLWEGETRSGWFNNAVGSFFANTGKLPEKGEHRLNFSVPVTVSLDRRLMQVMDWSAKDFNVTRSEWLRRVAKWHLDDLKRDFD